MTAPEEERLAHERSRALDLSGPRGATIVNTHLNRQQEVVGVTKDDLEDILGFDGIAAFFAGVGMFMLSGAAWLVVENSMASEVFAITPLMSFCLACCVFGLVFLAAGGFFHWKKRGRIKKIFEQTKPVK